MWAADEPGLEQICPARSDAARDTPAIFAASAGSGVRGEVPAASQIGEDPGDAHAGVALAHPVDGASELRVSLEECERGEEDVGGVDVLVEDGVRAVLGGGRARREDVVRVARLPRLEVDEVGERGERRGVGDDRAAVGHGRRSGAERAHDLRGEAVEGDDDRLVLGVRIGRAEVVEEVALGLDRHRLAFEGDGARGDDEKARFHGDGRADRRRGRRAARTAPAAGRKDHDRSCQHCAPHGTRA